MTLGSNLTGETSEANGGTDGKLRFSLSYAASNHDFCYVSEMNSINSASINWWIELTSASSLLDIVQKRPFSSGMREQGEAADPRVSADRMPCVAYETASSS